MANHNEPHNKHDKELFIEACKEVHGDKYNYQHVEYINSQSKVDIECSKHGVFSITPNNHISQRTGCKLCKKEEVLEASMKEWLNECLSIHGSTYDYSLVSFRKQSDKVDILCSKHGLFNQEARSHKRGSGCPKCKQSKGESSIVRFLELNCIFFEEQKTFKDCVSIKRLSYDFYIPSKNLLIEFQGKQHYQPIKRFGGVDKLHKQQIHDNIKRKYAKSNGYRLLEIPYTSINSIVTILTNNILI